MSALYASAEAHTPSERRSRRLLSRAASAVVALSLVSASCAGPAARSLPAVIEQHAMTLLTGRALVLSVHEPVTDAQVRRLIDLHHRGYREVHVFGYTPPAAPGRGHPSARWDWICGDLAPTRAPNAQPLDPEAATR